eukprot:TRINITY_DN24159_c0_g1_i1.p1 TRINITY_DN24159_c0_g1~~TRINITY_DN24159_c0_g1_i1.p1  ORF type:complete len:266 (-),score=34.47 TRINITY_DN24159_c0_g1_i1:265-1062(-)
MRTMSSQMVPDSYLRCAEADASYADSREMQSDDYDPSGLLSEAMPAKARLGALLDGVARLLSRRIRQGVSSRTLPSDTAWEIFEEVRSAEAGGATSCLDLKQYIMRLLACLDGTDVDPVVVLVTACFLLSSDSVPLKDGTWKTLTFTAILVVLRQIDMHPDSFARSKSGMLSEVAHFWPESHVDIALKAFEDQHYRVAADPFSGDELEIDSQGSPCGLSTESTAVPSDADGNERSEDDTDRQQDYDVVDDEIERWTSSTSTKVSL